MPATCRTCWMWATMSAIPVPGTGLAPSQAAIPAVTAAGSPGSSATRRACSAARFALQARNLSLMKPGTKVMLENQDSVQTGPIRLRVTQRIRQDCVYMVHGFGREDRRLSRGYGKGASDARLVTRIKRDPVMGGTGMNVNFVTIFRAKEA